MTQTTAESNGTGDALVATAADQRIEALEADLVSLRAERDLLVEERDRLRTSYRQAQERVFEAQRRHEQDIAMIGERLIAEADNRDWCDEYDQIVADLNGNLHVSLPERKKAYTVTISGHIEVPFTYELEIEEARDEDDAVEQAQEQFGYNVTAEDLLAYHSETTMAEVEDTYNLEYEAEEA